MRQAPVSFAYSFAACNTEPANESEPSNCQDYLPPSVRESIQNILENGAFFGHKSPVVLLPPPIGLFPNMKQTVSDLPMGVLHDPLHRTQDAISSFQSDPVSHESSKKGASSCSTACNSSFIDAISNKRQMPRSSGSDADSDDSRSQCSTASYDGSQGSKGKNHESNQGEQAPKKRTWKVLLTSEQACEVESFMIKACRFF